MLILRRKIAERARIETPCGLHIWITQGDKRVFVHAPECEVFNLESGCVKVLVGNRDMITVKYLEKSMHSVTKTWMNLPGIGIDAPRGYDIKREELIPA